MKIGFGCALLLCILFVSNFVSGAPPKKYNFVTAKCVPQSVNKDIGGPLNICTFPPRYSSPPQRDIDAVIEHIQELNL